MTDTDNTHTHRTKSGWFFPLSHEYDGSTHTTQSRAGTQRTKGIIDIDYETTAGKEVSEWVVCVTNVDDENIEKGHGNLSRNRIGLGI